MLNKGLKVILSMVIAVSLLTPFSIYAYDSPVVGINYTIGGITTTDTRSRSTASATFTDYQKTYTYNAEILLDKSYIGYMNVTFQYYYYEQAINGTVSTLSGSAIRSIYVNGSSANFSFSISSWYTSAPLIAQQGATYSPVLTINTSDLKEYTVDEKSYVPIETYPFIEQIFRDGKSATNWNQYINYYFPTFEFASGDKLWGGWIEVGTIYYLSFWHPASIRIDNYSQHLTFNNFNVVNVDERVTYQGNHFYTITLEGTSRGQTTINVVSATKILPVYMGYNTDTVSTDFAIFIGVKNSFMKDIEKIANGTTESTSAAVDSQTANSQLQTSSNQLFTQEDSFKSDMNSAMSNIPSFSVNNFGSKFMTSATWVRQQYERMTNNTPFQQVITFSLLVGLSMILIGKVRK